MKEEYPVVYVDAWKQDYSDDPLMTVISSMIKQLREQAGKGEEDPLFKTPRKLIGLLKAAAPSIARGVATRYLGIDPVKIIQQADDGDIGEAIRDENGQEIDMGLAASKMVEHLIKDHDAKSDAIASLKLSVEQWVSAVVGLQQKQSPAFIFIDELDRCRPSYAVEMLETIKHIFDIPGVVFVVATDTEQLQHTIKAIYGEGFDARTYLGRFFNSRYTLKSPSFEKLLPVHCDIEKLSESYFNDRNIKNWPELDVRTEDSGVIPLKNLTTIYNAFSLSARQVIQVTERLISIVEHLKAHSHINLLYLVFLLCLREKNQFLYDSMIAKNMDQTVERQKTLSNLINELALIGDLKPVEVELSPRELFNEFHSDLQSIETANQIGPDKQYVISIHQFIGISHSFIKSKHPNSSNLKGQSIRNLSHHNNRNSSTDWVVIFMDRETTQSTYDISTYKDLVELASALDIQELEST